MPVLHSCQDNEGASNSAEEDGEGEELDEEEEEGIPHLLYNNSEDSDPGGIQSDSPTHSSQYKNLILSVTPSFNSKLARVRCFPDALR